MCCHIAFCCYPADRPVDVKRLFRQFGTAVKKLVGYGCFAYNYSGSVMVFPSALFIFFKTG